ncbi:MAG: AbrB/MazE/SpoVT family DNA-binding domain-containing protein [Thaumarchaeota archaeon]|nr:AbrB/MazE/SpoVT family DNA-binding domain-containing protein [Nitrososphaerota archaeon]
MTAHVVKVTRRGQTTIPQELREKYGIKEGDDLMIEDIDGQLVIRRIPKLQDLAGADSDSGEAEEVKKEVEKTREEY